MSFCLKADYSNLLWNKMIKCLWGFFINMGACYPQTGPGPSNSILSSAWILGFLPTVIGYDLRLPLTFLTNILVTNMFREICKSEVLKNRLQLTNKWKKKSAKVEMRKNTISPCPWSHKTDYRHTISFSLLY